MPVSTFPSGTCVQRDVEALQKVIGGHENDDGPDYVFNKGWKVHLWQRDLEVTKRFNHSIIRIMIENMQYDMSKLFKKGEATSEKTSKPKWVTEKFIPPYTHSDWCRMCETSTQARKGGCLKNIQYCKGWHSSEQRGWRTTNREHHIRFYLRMFEFGRKNSRNVFISKKSTIYCMTRKMFIETFQPINWRCNGSRPPWKWNPTGEACHSSRGNH